MSALRLAVILALASVATAAMTSSAQAQKVVLGPVSGDVGGDSVRKAAGDALGDALRMQGLTVIFFEEAKRGLPASEPCDESCAARLLRLVSADLSAVVRIGADEKGIASRAQVSLLDVAGHHFDGSAAVRDGDIRDATTRALLEARSYQLLGPGPWLRVEGTPEGAEVLLDGSVVGTLPYRAAIASGPHQLIVRGAGYSRFQKIMAVPEQDGLKLNVRVALEPAPIEAPSAALEPAAPPPSASSESGSAWLVMPVVMGALGIGLTAVTSVRLASGINPCVDPDSAGRCTARSGVRIWSTVGGYALGAGLIGAGLAWIILGTDDGTVAHDEQPRLTARVGVDRVSVSGSF